MVQRLFADQSQASSHEYLNSLIGISNARMNFSEMTPFTGDVTGFFKQLSTRRFDNRLTWVNLACGQFEKHLAQRISELPLE